jgi:acetyl-CoA carboxylase biotin carboxyl carrier protein
MKRDGRVFEPVIEALLRDGERAGTVALAAPVIGLWRNPPAVGELISPGSDLGEIEVLGRLHRLQAPAKARGVVVEIDTDRARRPVGHGDRLMVLDTEATVGGGATADDASDDSHDATGGLVVRSPSSGRFYARPAPDKPPFVSAGDEIATGHTICLLEVMKTFNRVTYGGSGLPERARVIAVVPADESDLDAGDVILELEEI